ncbi:hypothetical protein NEUTE1DRAFT_115059 [Neurospora tetrasperma FGSC 2508]|uniref:Uncharacterized protein n=1 Tax=Neurospora tetrasperma (strain FGSC 2508 / ATCC MYA-4615 / P0657) TaxID=510951 RepID=F8N1Y9_NEUT8|nr:uncharacterized protein NEUTE1DRAFT_115059 [Neurospora tetrasperma FGSC 2508]EGO53213.1 hypothetical protein NEUTE1DRAFT_115059 [Neurospora tetrasperma FGSC 2508]
MYAILKHISRKLAMLSVKLAIIRKDEFMSLSTLVPLYIPHLKLDWDIAPYRRFESFKHRFSVAQFPRRAIQIPVSPISFLTPTYRPKQQERKILSNLDTSFGSARKQQHEGFADRGETAPTIVEVTFVHLNNRMNKCNALGLPWGESTPKQPDNMDLKLAPTYEKPVSAEYIPPFRRQNDRIIE